MGQRQSKTKARGVSTLRTSDEEWKKNEKNEKRTRVPTSPRTKLRWTVRRRQSRPTVLRGAKRRTEKRGKKRKRTWKSQNTAHPSSTDATYVVLHSLFYVF
jgi:hypothetical protein